MLQALKFLPLNPSLVALRWTPYNGKLEIDIKSLDKRTSKFFACDTSLQFLSLQTYQNNRVSEKIPNSLGTILRVQRTIAGSYGQKYWLVSWLFCQLPEFSLLPSYKMRFPQSNRCITCMAAWDKKSHWLILQLGCAKALRGGGAWPGSHKHNHSSAVCWAF